METALIGGVYSMTANEVLSGKELSFMIKSLGVLSWRMCRRVFAYSEYWGE